MFQAEGIMMPVSKEANFFRKFYCTPYVSFSAFEGERGLVYYCLLENCGATPSPLVRFSIFRYLMDCNSFYRLLPNQFPALLPNQFPALEDGGRRLLRENGFMYDIRKMKKPMRFSGNRWQSAIFRFLPEFIESSFDLGKSKPYSGGGTRNPSGSVFGCSVNRL